MGAVSMSLPSTSQISEPPESVNVLGAVAKPPSELVTKAPSVLITAWKKGSSNTLNSTTKALNVNKWLRRVNAVNLIKHLRKLTKADVQQSVVYFQVDHGLLCPRYQRIVAGPISY